MKNSIALIDQSLRQIYQAIGERLRDLIIADFSVNAWPQWGVVWSHRPDMGVPAYSLSPDGTYLRIDWQGGMQVSVALRLGDARIGLIFRVEDLGGDTRSIETFFPYPDGPVQPARLLRHLGDTHILVDFVFYGQRFGDAALLRSALSGVETDAAIIVHACAQEVKHLVLAASHHLASQGIFLGVGRIDANCHAHVFTLFTPDVASALGITPAQLTLVGPGDEPGSKKWMAIVPTAQEEAFLSRLHQVSHEEFMQRQSQPQTFTFSGMQLQVSSGVYHPAEGSSTRFFLKVLDEDLGYGARDMARQGDGVLDLGCGAGAIAIWLKKRWPDVTVWASDLSEQAVADTRANATRNDVDLNVVHSDLFDALAGCRFGMVIWNYPFWQWGDDAQDTMGIDPSGGMLRRFFTQLPDHLAPGAWVYLTYSTMSDMDLLQSLAAGMGYRVDLLSREGCNGYERMVCRLLPGKSFVS